MICERPNPELGVALRFAGYVDCQARALGENGFQALTGGPLMASLLSGLVTIFVALIGYRLLLGRTPGIRDGVSWTVRLGVVLTLTTSWPAFQVLAYNVAVDGPVELASYLLPANGLPSEPLDYRLQQAYDTIRIGFNDQVHQTLLSPDEAVPSSAGAPGSPAAPAVVAGLSPLPQTASVFMISTVGVIGAFRFASGFLLAVGPLAIMGLLFDSTLGLFSGWVRALGGACFALLGATIVTAVDLAFVEGELASRQVALTPELARGIDPQALPTIVLAFCVVMLITTLAAVRVASAFKLLSSSGHDTLVNVPVESIAAGNRQLAVAENERLVPASVIDPGPSRAHSVADGLATSVRREELRASGSGSSPEAPSRHSVILKTGGPLPGGSTSLGTSGRRSIARRTRQATRRDSLA